MRPPNTSTVLEAAVKLKTSQQTILGMIAGNEFNPPAINIGNGKKRPRWAIPNEAIESVGKPAPEGPQPVKGIRQHV